MIRRDSPRGSASPKEWLLISQTDHARLSHQLAEVWGASAVPQLVCSAGEPDHPLAATRREFLEAVRDHDDGWRAWDRSPRIDPQAGRPYSFTEMPTHDAQRIWDDSISACRAHGPLAGWVVASHFSALQSKRDGDYPEWIDWLARVDRVRADWLAGWLAESRHHTRFLAECCLAWLQTLDWISLWLCCRCPVSPKDAPIEPLSIGDDDTGWPAITLTAQPPTGPAADRVVTVSPWVFDKPRVRLQVTARPVPILDYKTEDRLLAQAGKPVPLGWLLTPPPTVDP